MKFVFLLILSFNFLFSQTWYNHSELVWKKFETKHFIFYYHEGAEKTISEAAYVAEKIYKPITSYYNYEPKTKTSIIIKDTDDIANGTAYYYDNKIEIWAHPLDFDLRGSHRWLQNVITHEFTHIIQIGSSMKASTRFPAIYFQGFSYEDEKRDDVLYGYPNTMFSIPVPGVAVPPWLAEGTAQYMSPELKYDFWDSHRDMVLRDLVLNQQLLSFNQMNTFGKKGIGGEAVYNQGFSFSNYLLNRFGSSILPKISDELSKSSYSINNAILKSTNNQISGYQLYQEWVLYLKNFYDKQLEKVFKNMTTGKIIENKGTTNLFPKISPNGEKLAYISNKENDYFGQTDLFIYDFVDTSKKKLISGVKYAPAWINDTTLIFTMRSKPNKYGSRYYDLYKMSLNQKEPDQITMEKRLRSPSFNSNRNLLAAINTVDGLSNIFISDADSIKFTQLTNFNNQEYISTISWDNEQNKIYADVILNHGRDIYVIDLDSKSVSVFIDNYDDCRNPIHYDGKTYFSTDYNGIFNIALKDSSEIKFLTNVTGGAFMPELHDDKLVYSLYNEGGYKIAMIDKLKTIDTDYIGYKNAENLEPSNIQIPNNMTYTDFSSEYETSLTEFHFVPRVMFDYGTIKYGFYGFTEDMVGHLSLFGGFSINKLSDVDAMIMLEYKKLYPTLYANLFWASRNTEQDFDYYTVDSLLVDNIDIKNEVDYHLFSSDLGFRFVKFNLKFWLNYNYTLYNQKIYQTVTQEFISDGENQKITSYGKLGFDYYKGNILSLRVSSKKIKPQFLGNMIPKNGYLFDMTFGYEWNDFMEGIALNEDYGTYGSVLKPNNTGRFDLSFSWYNYFKKINLSIENSLRIAYLFNNEVDDFFHFFGGGMPGLKGYTFYDENLTGRGMISRSMYFRKLIINNSFINYKDFIGFDKLSLGLVFQYGDAFPIERPKFSTGFEFRSRGFLFYGYPAALTFEHHYPITDENNDIKFINLGEGKSYFKLLFDF
tara:strand:- start:13132 stop:16104 length:2973 start_codon:yes stop_codon:yes gene_type:complete